jgi:RNA polymerase sigma-70 factor (ECF subfamily)
MEDAEDIVQDVFLRLWERGAHFAFDDPLPYLYQAARNAATSAARKKDVRARWQVALRAESDSGSSTVEIDLEERELDAAVAAAIDSLPERCREIFTMHRQQDLTYPEIARVLGISVKTVETQMGRALKALRSRLVHYTATLGSVVAALSGAGGQ